jgi:CubicO group peptidase (beta-lactamase class C family)
MSSCTPFLALLSIGHAAAAGPRDPFTWEPIRQLLSGWKFTTEYAVSIGTAEHGQLFQYEGGKFSMETQIPTGSTSKWPSAMMFAGLVADGTIASLDDPVHKYLKYWTSNPLDMRSEITLRHLLTFTSGFGSGDPGDDGNGRAARKWRMIKYGSAAPRVGNTTTACNEETGEISECARSIYEEVPLIGRPGHVWSYNSNHLQVAAGLAVAASGLSIEQVIHKYLFDPLNMTQSRYSGKCPEFAAGLRTTGADYARFLRGVVSYKFPSAQIVLESEKDATPFNSDKYGLYGNYAFGHFLLCFDSVDGFTDACADARSHFDPGAFGFMPIIDRKYGYWFEVVAAEFPPTGSYPLSGIPEYLAVALKPHVEAIFSQHPPESQAHLHHTPSFGTEMSIADVNYCLDCKLNPDNCS